MKWLITLMLLAMAAGCGSETGVGSTDAGITQSDGSDSSKAELPFNVFWVSVKVETPDGLPADIKISTCGCATDVVSKSNVTKLESEVAASEGPNERVSVTLERKGYAFLTKNFAVKKSDPKVVVLAADWLPGQWGVDMGGALYLDSDDNVVKPVGAYVDWKAQEVQFLTQNGSKGILNGKKILPKKEKPYAFNGEFSSDLSVITYSAENINGLKWSGTLTRVK